VKLCNTQYSIYSIYSVDSWKVEIRSYREVLHNQYEGWWADLPQNRVWKWVAKCIRYLLNVMRIMIFGKGTSLNSTVKLKGLLTTHLKKLSRIMWHNLLLNSPPKSDIFSSTASVPAPLHAIGQDQWRIVWTWCQGQTCQGCTVLPHLLGWDGKGSNVVLSKDVVFLEEPTEFEASLKLKHLYHNYTDSTWILGHLLAQKNRFGGYPSAGHISIHMRSLLRWQNHHDQVTAGSQPVFKHIGLLPSFEGHNQKERFDS